jgi:hypothetical protein
MLKLITKMNFKYLEVREKYHAIQKYPFNS